MSCNQQKKAREKEEENEREEAYKTMAIKLIETNLNELSLKIKMNNSLHQLNIIFKRAAKK